MAEKPTAAAENVLVRVDVDAEVCKSLAALDFAPVAVDVTASGAVEATGAAAVAHKCPRKAMLIAAETTAAAAEMIIAGCAYLNIPSYVAAPGDADAAADALRSGGLVAAVEEG